MLVDDGIYLDDLEAEHAAVVGDDFHCEVRLAIGGSAADGRAHARSIFGIDPIHIERHVITGSPFPSQARRFFHYRAHPTLVDITHGENTNSSATDIFFLNGIDVAHTHKYAVLRSNLRRKSINIAQIRRTEPHQRA